MDIFDLIKKKELKQLYEYIQNNPTIDLDVCDENYNYFIQYIVMYNASDILKYILQYRNLRLDILDTDGRNLLYIPIKYNYFEILEILLEYDKHNIGLSIINVRDNIGYIGLHYCIIFNNITAFNLLYTNKSDINIVDNKGHNIYMICLQYKRSTMLIYLLENEIKNNHNINHFININGESILQSAITYDDIKVVNYIINNTHFIKQLVNIKENEYGLTALHQAIVLNLNDIVIRIIEHGANVNNSDYLGNTPLHYAVIEKNYYVLDNLIKRIDINMNSTNMNGNTPLHLLLDSDIIDANINDSGKNIYDMYNIVLRMLQHTDINIMNNDGNTVLHYMVLKNIWNVDKIKEYLVNGTTHMNIFICNKNNMSVFDIIKLRGSRELKSFIDVTVDSYYNILKQLKDNSKLTAAWEIQCAINSTNIQQCKNIIKQQIVEQKQSIPTYPIIKFNIDNGIFTSGCFYTGSTIDILFGLFYLYKQHNNVKLILEYPLIHNKEIENYYIKMGLNYSFKMEFANIEIVWSFMKLIYPMNFDSVLQSKLKTADNHNMIVIPLGIEVSMGSHANIIIIDINKNTVERFEPNGKHSPRGFYYNSDLLDTLLTNKFNDILPSYKYIAPLDYLPTIGFQLLETIDDSTCKKIGDPNGFCAVWCVWWVEQKILNPAMQSKELAEELIKYIKFSNKSFKKLIRNFSMNIVQLRDKMLEKYKLTIDEWMSNHSDNIIVQLEQDILEQIDSN